MEEIKGIFVFFCLVSIGLLGYLMITYLDSGAMAKQENEVTGVYWDENTPLESDLKEFEEEFNRLGIVPGMSNKEYFDREGFANK